MFESCEKDKEECQFIFRYYPDHPQRKKIVENVEKACRNQNDQISGGSVCVDVGIYYFDRNEKEKGFDFLDLSCKKNNPTACQALIGLEDTTEKKDQAFKKFCIALSQSTAVYSQPINRFCGKDKPEKINGEIISAADDMIRSWRSQIKSK